MKLRSIFRRDLSLSFFMLGLLLTLLWVAGGASRADALGQVVVRAGAWAVIAAAVLFGPRPDFKPVMPILLFMGLVILLPLMQLMPSVFHWSHHVSSDSLLANTEKNLAREAGTLSPSATLNALSSLVVPTAVLILFSQLDLIARHKLLSILFVLIVLSVVIGLLQFSGLSINNPFVNDLPQSVSSIFANRNHFALLVSIGCVITPVWAFIDRDKVYWRSPVAALLLLLFMLTILAIGSRTGLLLLALACLMAIALVGNRLKQLMRRAPSWMFRTSIVVVLIAVITFTTLSFAADRVDTVDRLLGLAADEDMRNRARPLLLNMIWTYMPLGAGLGSFDSAFRLAEPLDLLTFQYFNQAHNDYLGIALDAGFPGILLVVFVIAWWAYSTVRVVRSQNENMIVARAGSAILLLVLVASITDYPARTPIIMSIIVIAAGWLANGSSMGRSLALPQASPNV